MPTHPLSWLEPHAERRRAAGLRRELRPRAAHDPVLDLAGNDYLGLATHPEVTAAAARALSAYGLGATGS
ncbi:MAG TPA: 8-amino-7-oxononanoate synthase, partial [Pseudonocardia sp.]|nr:8-amino-7-oxononanoate synthase [Pseudonocardia sp.]